MRAVIDSNIWVSAVLTPDGFSSRLAGALAHFAFEPIFCDATLLEFKDAVTEPRAVARYGWRLQGLNALVSAIATCGEEWPDPQVIPISRDPKDDIFIALGVAAGADYLVTRDDDLKGDPKVRDYLARHGVGLVTVREFLDTLEQQEGEPGGSP